MDSDNLSIAKIVTDPVPAFRNESAAISETDPVFGQLQLVPRSLAMITKVSRELLADGANTASVLYEVMTKSMSSEMDKIILQGTGSAPQPRGILNTSGIGNTALAGALTDYSSLITAQTGILSNDGGPVSAIVMHPRDAGKLAGLTATDGQPLNIPPSLASVPILQTSALQIDAGSGNDESSILLGNFAQCVIGLRSGIEIQVLKERYAENGMFAFVSHMRFDVGVIHPAAFHKVSAVQG